MLQADSLGQLYHLYGLSYPWPGKTQALLSLHGKYITYDWLQKRIVAVRETAKGGLAQAPSACRACGACR